jgi:hypothetical protein
VIPAVASITQQQILARLTTNRTLLALNALPLDGLVSQMLTQTGRILETLGVTHRAAVPAHQEPVVFAAFAFAKRAALLVLSRHTLQRLYLDYLSGLKGRIEAE